MIPRGLGGPVAPLACIAAALLPMIAIAAAGRFDGLYGADSIAYFQYATGPLRDALLRGQAPPPFFWPLGYPLLVSAASLAVGAAPLAGQLVALSAAAVVPAASWWLALSIGAVVFDAARARRVAVVAGMLVAVTGQLWQSGIVVMADTTGVAFATISAGVLARYAVCPTTGTAGTASGLLALGVLARWGSALLALPWAVVVLLRGGSRRVWHAAVATLAGLALLAPQTVLSIRSTAETGFEGAPFAGDLAVYSWNPMHAFQRVFQTVDGELAYAVPNGWYYLALPFHWAYLTVCVVPFALAGAYLLVSRRHMAQAAIAVGWPLTLFLFHAGAPWQNFRFALAYLPPIAVLAALGFESWAGRSAGAPTSRRWTALLVFVLALKAAAGIWLCRDFIARKDRLVETVRWAESRLPADATLVTFNVTAVFQQYGRLETRELYYLAADDITADVDDNQFVFLLVDVANLETQWRESGPGQVYRRLLDDGRLRVVSTRDGLTLFQVGERPSS